MCQTTARQPEQVDACMQSAENYTVEAEKNRDKGRRDRLTIQQAAPLFVFATPFPTMQ